MVELGIIGLTSVLLKLLGPVQEKLTPGVAEVAVKDKVVQLQTGEFTLADGVAGCVGSDKVNGPAAAEIHPFNVTVIFE